MTDHDTKITAALHAYHAAEAAGDEPGRIAAQEQLRVAVSAAYRGARVATIAARQDHEPCDRIAGDAGVAGWVAPW